MIENSAILANSLGIDTATPTSSNYARGHRSAYIEDYEEAEW